MNHLVWKYDRLMRLVGIFKGSVLVATSVVLFGVLTAIIPLTSTPNASALTSGIVTTELALNLDPNISASYSGTGTTITDLSTAGRNGTLQGTPLPVFDSAGPKSFEFVRTWVGDTASSAGKILVNTKFLTEDFTIQTWIKTDQVGYWTAHYTTMYIMASECGGGDDDWGLGVNNSGQLAFGAGPNDTTYATPETVNTNTWVNVAASRDKTSGEIKLYIDGVLKATGIGNTGNTLNCSADSNTWIGNGQDAPAYSFGGKISSVLAYTKVLSSADVLTNYNATLDTFHPVTYTISYNANDATSGTVPSNGSYTTGGAASTVAANTGALARTGYTFAGWNTSPSGTGTAYAAGTGTYSSRADVTLYARWSAIPTTTTTTAAPPAVVINIQATATTIAPRKSTSVTTSTPANMNSVPTTTVGPITSTPLAPPSIPKVSTGETALEVDGESTKVDVTRENNQLVIKSGSMQAVLSGLDQNSNTRGLDSEGNLRLTGGDLVQINMGGFKPDSEIEVWLFSTPQQLGTATVGADGTVSGSFRIPNVIESGAHRIAVTAKLPNGKSATFTVGIAVGEMARSSTLTRVLIAIPLALAVGFGFILPNQIRRRRKKVIA